MKNNIKTRFAPSPTGYLHIGGLRTALYNYLFARQNKGKFIIRIEDTDQTRYQKNSEKNILSIIQKIGLKWDEGPFIDKRLKVIEKGQNKPYFQSKRLEIYQRYVNTLINDKKAYYCFCTKERLENIKKNQKDLNISTKYDGYCRKLNENEIKNHLNSSKPYVIRLKVPLTGQLTFIDQIRGKITISYSEIDDQVLLKSDGFPTYHLANVVDDYLMGITHVIRGEEWLPSTPKHLLIYQAFNWPAPQFFHLPLLLNPDKSKLSKRQGDVAVEDFLNKGYLPEALINYVVLLGWHPRDNKEIFNLNELINDFDIKRVQKAGAIFDLEKLNWFNNYYLRQKNLKQLVRLSQQFIPKIDKKILIKIIKYEKERIQYLAQIKEIIDPLIKENNYDINLLIFQKSTKIKTLQGLESSIEKLKGINKWSRESIKNILLTIVNENKLSNGDVFWPTRVALSGLSKSLPPEEIMDIIGKKETLKRLKRAIFKLKYN